MAEPAPVRSNEEAAGLGEQSSCERSSDSLSSGVGGIKGWTRFLPAQWLQRSLKDWFSVSDIEVKAILERVRRELPTTEAFLLGKPQAGKSSIIRGLTGVSREIVGEGFRPYTRHIKRYTYPTADLPLLIFMDTVGLGDVAQETATVVDELLTELAQPEQAQAQVMVLTVKIADFAVDSLYQIASQIRRRYPTLPCLLAVTCLHEVYPASVSQHPSYPPEWEAITHPYAAIQQAFAGLYDRSVLIDFTLEEDGYTPVFYGLEALVDALAELLPDAEARAIQQLLEGEPARQLGAIYRNAGRRYILPFAVMAATLAAVPLPFATMPVLTALQVSLVGLLGRLYGQTISPSQAGGIVSAIAGGFLAQAVGRELIKFVPGFGSVVAASWAGAYTWALGETACVYFGDLLGGKKPDAQQIQAVMRESFEQAKQRFRQH